MNRRKTAIHGVEHLTGSTIAAASLRVILGPAMSVSGIASANSAAGWQQVGSMTEYEQAGLQTIRRISPQATKAYDFNFLLVIYPHLDRGVGCTESLCRDW